MPGTDLPAVGDIVDVMMTADGPDVRSGRVVGTINGTLYVETDGRELPAWFWRPAAVPSYAAPFGWVYGDPMSLLFWGK